MRHTRVGALQTFSTAAAVLALLAVPACTDGEASDATPTVPGTVAVPTASPPTSLPTRTSETVEERDARMAGEAVVKYWSVVDDLAAHPDKSVNLLDPVARDQARAQRQYILGTYAAKGLVQRGSVQVIDVSSKRAALNKYVVTACIDVTGVDLVDRKGKSRVDPNRPEKWAYTYSVANTARGFFVTEDQLKGKPC